MDTTGSRWGLGDLFAVHCWRTNQCPCHRRCSVRVVSDMAIGRVHFCRHPHLHRPHARLPLRSGNFVCHYLDPNQKAKTLRMKTKKWARHSRHEEVDHSIKAFLHKMLFLPIMMLVKEPDGAVDHDVSLSEENSRKECRTGAVTMLSHMGSYILHL
jgi:hypothetical protein